MVVHDRESSQVLQRPNENFLIIFHNVLYDNILFLLILITRQKQKVGLPCVVYDALFDSFLVVSVVFGGSGVLSRLTVLKINK